MPKTKNAKRNEDVWYGPKEWARLTREVVIQLGQVEALAAELRPMWRNAQGRADKEALAERLRVEAGKGRKPKMGPALAVLAYEEACGRDEGEFWRMAARVLLGLRADEFRQASVFAKAMMQLESEKVPPRKTAEALRKKGLDQRARETATPKGKGPPRAAGRKGKSNPMARRLAAKRSAKKRSGKA